MSGYCSNIFERRKKRNDYNKERRKTPEGKRISDILCIDHDHKTHKIRNLLCNNCNTGLGLFNDDILVLSSAIDYLKKYGGNID